MLLTSICKGRGPILSQRGMYALINSRYISASIIFRMGLSRGEIEGAEETQTQWSLTHYFRLPGQLQIRILFIINLSANLMLNLQ